MALLWDRGWENAAGMVSQGCGALCCAVLCCLASAKAGYGTVHLGAGTWKLLQIPNSFYGTPTPEQLIVVGGGMHWNTLFPQLLLLRLLWVRVRVHTWTYACDSWLGPKAACVAPRGACGVLGSSTGTGAVCLRGCMALQGCCCLGYVCRPGVLLVYRGPWARCDGRSECAGLGPLAGSGWVSTDVAM